MSPETAATSVAEAPPVESTNASQLRWESVLMVEGKATDDGRMIEPGAIQWRELPLSLMAMIETSAGGHEGAQVAGRIDRIWRVEGVEPGVNEIRGSGVFDDSEFGAEVARLVSEQMLRGVSVDLAIREFEFRPKDDTEEVEEPDLLDLLFDVEMLFVVTDGSIGAATVCPFPAFADAEIALVSSAPLEWRTTQQSGMTVVEVEAPAEVEPEPEPVVASAAPVVPPLEWFDDPELEQATPIHITDEGRIFGHAAAWDVCHIGFSDTCVLAPRTQEDYAHFLLGEVEVALPPIDDPKGEQLDGTGTIPCGQITLGTGHANLHMTAARAAEHYDNTGTVAAHVTVGEDDHGIWVAGALSPALDEERVRELRGAKLSGDWRSLNGNLELVAVLAVNVPGFPVPRVLIASADPLLEEDAEVEEQFAEALALVSAGVISPAILERKREADRAAADQEAEAELELGRMAAESSEGSEPVPFVAAP